MTAFAPEARPVTRPSMVARLADSLGDLAVPSMQNIKKFFGADGESPDSGPTLENSGASSFCPHSTTDVHSKASALASGLKPLNYAERKEAVELLAHLMDDDMTANELFVALDAKVEDSLQQEQYQHQHEEDRDLMSRENREVTSVLAQFRQRFMQALTKLVAKVNPAPAATPDTDAA